MQAELISIATDTIPLDGLFYAPPSAGRAVMLMHGNTMNFYVGAPRFLPPELVRRGYACLAYNRRGHDVLSTYASRELTGGAFQTVAQAIADNEQAGAWLAGRGFAAPVVVGHSHGGMLASCYAASHAETPALVLMSAHRGGPELMRASGSGNFTQGRHEEFLRRAEDMVARGEGRGLLHLPGWYYAMSAATYLDASTSMPSLIEQARRISCPVLFIRGDAEPADNYPAELFAESCAGPCEVRIIADCDHFYGGHEQELAVMVGEFLDRHLA
jgi:pimeloyl-ACP methyl ester carboxylesterase